MSPSQQEEVKFAMTKWNREGAPEESQVVKNNLKKTLEDISEQIRRTMGCRVVMFVSHKKKASQTLSVSLHETDPQNVKKRFSVSSNGIKEWTATGFESFAEWSKTEFYPSDDQDLEGSDNEDAGNEAAIPEIILDDDGYAKLPSRDGIGLRGQHELIRGIFHASYKVCTGGSRPVPWGMITAASSNYLEHGSVPTAFVVKDPSHMKTEEVNRLWNHWEQNLAANKKLVVFVKAKDGDVRANVRNEERKKKSKEKRVSLLDSDEEDSDRLPSLNSSDFTERRTQPAITTPDDVSIDDRYAFLESLSKNKDYLELIDAIRDLAKFAKQKPTSEENPDLPIWANWSWGESYLPEDVHVSYDTLKASLEKLRTSPISGAASAMPVILGIGLLYRESKRVIEYEEDEADPNTPFYLPGSAFDLEVLVSLDQVVRQVLATVVEHIEKLAKGGLGEVPGEEVVLIKGKEKAKAKAKAKETQEEEQQQQEHEEQEQEEEEQEEEEEEQQQQQQQQKGRKRRMPQASTNEFQLAFAHLTQAIARTVEEKVPKAKTSPYAKRWWSKTLEAERKEVHRLGHKARSRLARRQDPIHEEYCVALQQTIRPHQENQIRTLGRMAQRPHSGKHLGPLSLLQQVTRTIKYTLRIKMLKDPQEPADSNGTQDNKRKSELLYEVFFRPPPENEHVEPNFNYPPPICEFAPVTNNQIYLCYS
ncbi:hypothetical protein DEU56DRAFT_919030 [Suillus clintonianus]|uniref:uncharacterized protein n=1 Tax=Suillus clintonianus TaxID=1904413 RepID=UPI001B85DBD0|nr:uncharacterized protein DEU56DRAFT_919030 [Suillus clintonianus]KAG2117573.1 hypothetical protein DEU56DRAFT_919030 [Suillus clintonianus]